MAWFSKWWEPTEAYDYVLEDMKGDFKDYLFPFELSNIDYARRTLELLRRGMFMIVQDLSASGKAPKYDSSTVGRGIDDGDGNDLFYIMKYLQRKDVQEASEALGVHFDALRVEYEEIHKLRNKIAHSATTSMVPSNVMFAMTQVAFILNPYMCYPAEESEGNPVSTYRALLRDKSVQRLGERIEDLYDLASMYIHHQLSKADRLSSRFGRKVASEAAIPFHKLCFEDNFEIQRLDLCTKFEDFKEELLLAERQSIEGEAKESTSHPSIQKPKIQSKPKPMKCVNFNNPLIRCGGYRSSTVDSNELDLSGLELSDSKGPGFNFCVSCRENWEKKSTVKGDNAKIKKAIKQSL